MRPRELRALFLLTGAYFLVAACVGPRDRDTYRAPVLGPQTAWEPSERDGGLPDSQGQQESDASDESDPDSAEPDPDTLPDPDPDSTEPENLACTCEPDGVRHCADGDRLRWGTQVCAQNDGARGWDSCVLSSIAAGCEPGGARAAPFEWHYRTGFWDGGILDEDGDGIILSLPEDWLNPAAEDCAIRAALCVQDYWDLDNDRDVLESQGDCQGIETCVPVP